MLMGTESQCAIPSLERRTDRLRRRGQETGRLDQAVRYDLRERQKEGTAREMCIDSRRKSGARRRRSTPRCIVSIIVMEVHLKKKC